VEFRILGPLEVVEDGNPVALGTLKERLVLGVLLLHANEFVSRERIIDDLWGEAPPPTARKAVNVYVSKLRKALTRDGHDPIATADGGYRVIVQHPDRLDAERARSLVAEARQRRAAGEPDAASGLLQDALSLWRGPTLAGLRLESRGRDEAEQLDELRLAAQMDRIDCDLALGRDEQVLGELNVLVREHPLRERLRAQQMLALYRAGRQAEALDAYAEARRVLVDDLGIEPSDALQRLQQAILRHDASLETSAGTAAVNGPAPVAEPQVRQPEPEPLQPRFRPRRSRLVVAGATLLAGAAAAAAILSASASATPRVVPNSLVELNPRTGKPILVEPVGNLPNQIAITPTAIWTANYGSDDVSRYDLRSHKVDTRGVTPGQPFDIVFDREGNAWVTNTPANDEPVKRSVVIRLQQGTGGTAPGQIYPSHVDPIHFPLPMAGYEALGAGYVWVIVGGHGPLPGDDRVALVDLATKSVASVVQLHHSATSIAFGYGSAWIGTYTSGEHSWLEAIRAGNRKPTKVVLQSGLDVNWGPVWIAVGEGAVWVIANRETGYGQRPVLFEIDPQTLKIVHRLDLSAQQSGVVAVGAGAVWVTGGIAGGNNMLANSITEIDPRTDRIVRTTPLSNPRMPTCGLAATRAAVWVTLGSKSCDTIGS
jgi:DNA-binding SARP family transcriptional activator